MGGGSMSSKTAAMQAVRRTASYAKHQAVRSAIERSVARAEPASAALSLRADLPPDQSFSGKGLDDSQLPVVVNDRQKDITVFRYCIEHCRITGTAVTARCPLPDHAS